mmetsp:Transcript_97615/g.248028  ORF Transcript_97615/g.248028 Transcript_97615/m.248028 type:complete len:212 (-) Transcript_97615:1249-1884(-)
MFRQSGRRPCEHEGAPWPIEHPNSNQDMTNIDIAPHAESMVPINIKQVMSQLIAAASNMLAATSRSPPAYWSAIAASRLAKPIMTKVLTPPAAKPKQGRFLEVLASSLSSPLDTTSTTLPPPSERLPVLVLSIGSSFTTPPAAEVQGAGAAATRRAMPARVQAPATGGRASRRPASRRDKRKARSTASCPRSPLNSKARASQASSTDLRTT